VQTKFSLTEGSIPRALLAFALPILFGNVLQSVNGSVNVPFAYSMLDRWREIRMGVADASPEPVPTA